MVRVVIMTHLQVHCNTVERRHLSRRLAYCGLQFTTCPDQSICVYLTVFIALKNIVLWLPLETCKHTFCTYPSCLTH